MSYVSFVSQGTKSAGNRFCSLASRPGHRLKKLCFLVIKMKGQLLIIVPRSIAALIPMPSAPVYVASSPTHLPDSAQMSSSQ